MIDARERRRRRTSSGDGEQADSGRHEADAKLALGGAIAEVHGELLARLCGRSAAAGRRQGRKKIADMLILGAEDGVVVDVHRAALGIDHGEAGQNQDRETGEAGHRERGICGKADARKGYPPPKKVFFPDPPTLGAADDCSERGWQSLLLLAASKPYNRRQLLDREGASKELDRERWSPC